MLDALTPSTLPEYGIPPAIASPSPVHPVPAPVLVAATPTPSSPVDKSSLGDWQKAAIMGTIIGGFVFAGLWISRPQPATTSSNVIETEQSPPPEAVNPVPEVERNSPQVQKTPNPVPFIEQPDPKQFIINYYTNLTQRQYDTTWSKLSPNFKSKASTFGDYVDWWESVAEIRVGNVRSIAQTEREAIIDVELQYVMLEDRTIVDDAKSRINLVWDNRGQTWLFEDKFEP